MGGDIFSRFFDPESVAIIGSFKEGVFGGYVAVKSLRQAGYSGRIYPVNPSYDEVLGLRTYPSIHDTPDTPDVAMIMINARNVPDVLEQCARRGTRAVILVADGFAERNQEGALLQERITAMAREWGVRIIGPNTAGIVSPHTGFNPCPYEAGYYGLKPGPVAIFSQTGMINPQAYPYPQLTAGISRICDFGNKCDLDECDLLEYLEHDDKTRVISMYLESIRDGERFVKVCGRLTSKKPALALKLGTTPEGAMASASHTGSLAVDDRIFDAACRQAGVLRLSAFNELFEIPKIFATQPLPSGNRVGIVTYTGALGVLTSDQGAGYGLSMASLSPETADAFDRIFPELGHMPVDIGPMIPAVKDFSTVYTQILETVLRDENVDALFNVMWADARGKNEKAYIEAYEALKGIVPKPVVTWIYGPGPSAVRALKEQLEALGYPVFDEPERCVKSLGMACRYAQIRRNKNK
ncbi:MAG: CoA-binding protein [Deltaproteobacteria bacterium]|nr:CoA-binding protein [Deltaproteobacteria bacterium]